MRGTLKTLGVVGCLALVAGCVEGPGPAAGHDPPGTRTASGPQEWAERADLRTVWSVAAGGMQAGDPEAAVYVAVPDGATRVNATFAWPSTLGVGDEQHCMLHDGTGQRMGSMLSAAEGPSPLSVGPVDLDVAIERVGFMCWAHGDPAVALDHAVRVELRFTAGESLPP